MIKYPRTKHIYGSNIQKGDDDKYVHLSELLNKYLVIEEKMDGSNSGISFESDELKLQSRGHFLRGGPREMQFEQFKSWANLHKDTFYELLGNKYVMFGEWMFAKHSIAYDNLPHYFLEFDLYDKENKVFLSTEERRKKLEGYPVVSVKVLFEGIIKTEKEFENLLKDLVIESEFIVNEKNKLMEGLYFKQEEKDLTVDRFKYVRQEFIQKIVETGEHWSNFMITPNRLKDGINIFT